jgi:hypothetical protein
VGNFFIVVAAEGRKGEAHEYFHTGLDAARELKSQVPDGTAETDWALAASFPRENGPRAPLVTHSATGSWLLALGTWFHSEGYASGEEARLLKRCLETDPVRLGRELEGFFVLVIGDARSREVVVLTDIVGSCHCFMRTTSAGTILSSSSLLLAALEEAHLDPVACHEFISSGIIYEDRSCYREVRKLGPAGVFRFGPGGPKPAQRYWQISELAPESLGGDAAVDGLWESLTRAVRRVQTLYPNPLCDLTGGYDSRSLVAAFVGAGVRCTTVVSGPPESADVAISHGLAQILGLPHLHNEPRQQISFDQLQESLALADGEYDLVEYSQIRENHCRLASQFGISINGSFGEVARGYWWELLLPRLGARGPLDARRVARLRYGAQPFDASMFPHADRLDTVSHFVGIIERTNAGLGGFPNTFQMDHAYLMMRMQRWQGRIASSTNQIWPCLSLFLFRSVLETILRTRTLLRWRSLLVRKMLARYQPEMAAYPLEHGFPAEPTTWKNFYRFWPLAAYFGDKVGGKLARKLGVQHAATETPAGGRFVPRLALWREEAVKDLLVPAKMKLSGWLDPAALEAFFRRSQQPGFSFDEQWARVLSLELALRAAERLARRPRS